MIISDDLPSGWANATLADFGIWSSGGTPNKKRPEFHGGDIPWVLTGDLNDGFINDVKGRITQLGLESSSAKLFPEGTVLMAMYGATIGKLGVLKVDAATNQACAALLPNEENQASLPFVYFFLLANREGFKKAGKGGAQPNISQMVIKQTGIAVPPLNEQRRIVEKIETLFARLDKGEEAVREVQKLLKRYRQSILKSAVTGELTADWRAEREGELESGTDLLARILKTREENWQGRGKYKAPVEPDTANLPNLPEGWVWASLGQLIYKIEAGKNYRCQEVPPDLNQTGIVKISAVTWDEFNQEESKTIISDYHLNETLLINEGDLLISRANTIELVGASVVVRNISKRLQLSDKVLRLKCVEPIEHWVNYLLKSWVGRLQIEAMATGAQMSMRNISQKNLEKIAVPLPPREEIAAAIEMIVGAFDKEVSMSKMCETELKRSAALRQSILKDAFSGRLVPQDPDDEPALALLERIKEAKAAEPKKTSRKKRA